MEHVPAPNPPEPTRTPMPAVASVPVQGTGSGPRVGAIPAGPGIGRLPPSAILGLQRSAGNAATLALLQREAAGGPAPVAGLPAVQREGGGGVALSAKHTYTFPDKKLGQKDLSYAQATASLGGSIDYEVTPPPAPATAPAGPTPSPGGSGGEPTPLPSPGGPQVKGSAGVNASAEDVKYQAEVGVEFEKRAVGLFEGSTPKAKFGGEASGDKGKLGVEFSMEGQDLEPKFAFNLLEMDAQKGIHFATLEAAIDWKIHEFTHTASDGAALKITPKATFKVALEPNYERIFMYLLEEGGAAVAAEALIAGGMIAAGAFAIVGFLLTLGDGEAEARAIDNAVASRQKLVLGFVAGATGEQITPGDDFTMEGRNRGIQWRNDLKAGQRGNGVPVPPSVIDEKSKENKAKIEESAQRAATGIMRGALVQRYWEIHYISREVPWAEIDHVFMMLMEATGFGVPQPQEGKNVAGASVLPE